MRFITVPRTFPALLVAGVFALLSVANVTQAADKGKSLEAEWKEKGLKYQNATACTQCHISPNGNQLPKDGEPNRALNLVLLTEYSIWKTHDKHAQAYAVLIGKRGKKMGELLGQFTGKAVDVTKKEAGCINCHAMNGFAGDAEQGDLDLKDGVSCGGCHGPSTEWLGPHQAASWRKVSAAEKQKKGLRDLRDPEVRSQLCMSCHIGNAGEGKVVTHVMFAAGHPPLPPIEIATFSRNEPQHWRDASAVPFFRNASAEVAQNFHLKDVAFARTKLALVGSVVSLRETMRMAAERADFNAANPAVIWPEMLNGAQPAPPAEQLRKDAPAMWPEIAMAHSDCYGCHHDLKYPGYRQERGFGYQLPGRARIKTIPGRPLVRLWPTALLDASATYAHQPAKVDGLEKHLRTLAQVASDRPFGAPPAVAKASANLITWCDELVGELKSADYSRESIHKLMLDLCSLYEPQQDPALTLTPDYESAKQIASVLTVAFDDWNGDQKETPAARSALQALSTQLNLEPYFKREDRLDIIFQIVKDSNAGIELQGKEEFKNYLKNRNVGSVDVIKKMMVQAQGFLGAIRTLSNDDFNKGIAVDHINQLQDLSDAEEKITLQAISDFDPEVFRKNLHTLAAALKTAK